ncbi:MAG: universal stress protein [Desulfobacterales bacterium]|nr:universal stress protein [Desulfobacterales bacterium]
MTLNGGSCVWQATPSSPRWAMKFNVPAEAMETISIASHGLNALPRQFYGSTTAGVLQQIDRPLLLIRSRTV